MKKTGILLVNLGSPDAATPKAVRRYLKEFLSDTRVVDLPRWFWWPALHGFILNTRPKKVAKAYQIVWGKQSPLIETSQAIAKLLDGQSENKVVLAMRYGSPSVIEGLEALGDIDTLIVLPLFPQYSCATSASVFDAVSKYYKNKRRLPEIRFIRDYHDHPLYIDALAQSIQTHWDAQGKADKLLISFHGLPKRYIDEGDPYQAQCKSTAHLLAEKLQLKPSEWALTFQSRFGREPWLTPYTDEALMALPKEGITSVDVISPGFSADCLETLEELAIAGKKQFMDAGGKDFRYIPALNTGTAHIQLLHKLTAPLE